MEGVLRASPRKGTQEYASAEHRNSVWGSVFFHLYIIPMITLIRFLENGGNHYGNDIHFTEAHMERAWD